jgi:D-lyxose ketol-isomerase
MMLTAAVMHAAQQHAAQMIAASGIVVTREELERIEVSDFGLSHLDVEGAQILTLFATHRVSAKIIALFGGQTLPEHCHTAFEQDAGKEETLRLVAGSLCLYLPGEDNMRVGHLPAGKEMCYTVKHEVVLLPGAQITLQPHTKHWFQAGEQGAVLYSFSSCARDILDTFTDPNIVRTTIVEAVPL